VARGVYAITPSFYTEELDGWVFGEGVEHADCVATASDASYNCVGQFTSLLEHLGTGFIADYGLKGSYNGGEGVGTNSRSDNVVSCVELDDPGAQGFVDGITQGARASFDCDDLGAEKLDTKDVEGLASYIFLQDC
jgi:hypothetical protein